MGHAVPAGLAPAGDGVVHDVVRHQEEGLQPLDAPAERVGGKLGVWGQPRRAAGRLCVGGQGVRDGHAPVQLAAGHVEVEHLVVLACLFCVARGSREGQKVVVESGLCATRHPSCLPPPRPRALSLSLFSFLTSFT